MLPNSKKLVGQKPFWKRFVWLPLPLPILEAHRGLPELTGSSASLTFVGDAYHG